MQLPTDHGATGQHGHHVLGDRLAEADAGVETGGHQVDQAVVERQVEADVGVAGAHARHQHPRHHQCPAAQQQQASRTLAERERAQRVKKRNVFTQYGPMARQVIEALLDKYADEGIATMEGGGSYNQTDAEGFLRIQGLPHRVQSR